MDCRRRRGGAYRPTHSAMYGTVAQSPYVATFHSLLQLSRPSFASKLLPTFVIADVSMRSWLRKSDFYFILPAAFTYSGSGENKRKFQNLQPTFEYFRQDAILSFSIGGNLVLRNKGFTKSKPSFLIPAVLL